MGHDVFDIGRPMRISSLRHSSMFGRAEQAALLSAGTAAPLAYQRTLMPRSTSDQALVSGLAMATNYGIVAATQDAIQAVTLAILRGTGRAPVDLPAWSGTTLAADAGALVAGLATQRMFGQRHGEPLPRAAIRTTGYWIARSATAGLIVGAVQHATSRRTGGEGSKLAVVPAVAVMVGLGEWRRRESARADEHDADTATLARAKASGLGVAVAGLGLLASAGERRVADRVAAGASRLFGGHPAIWRPLG